MRSASVSFLLLEAVCVLPQKESLCELKWSMALVAWDILCYKLDLRFFFPLVPCPVWGISLSAFPSAFRRERGLESVSQARPPRLRRWAGLSPPTDETAAPAAALLPAGLPGAVRAGAAPCLRAGTAPRGLLRSPAGPHGSWWRLSHCPSTAPSLPLVPSVPCSGPGLPLSPPPR